MKVLCEVWLDNIWGEAIQQARLVSLDQSKGKRDLACYLYPFGLVGLALSTSGLSVLSKRRKGRDMIMVEDVKRRVIILRVPEKDMHNNVTIIGVFLSFDINKALEVLIVDNEVSGIAIFRNLDSSSFLFDFFRDLESGRLYRFCNGYQAIPIVG
jgi:hypothetical protein